MNRRSFMISILVPAMCVIAAITLAAAPVADDASPIYGIKIPAGYRQWEFISVAHEAGNFDDSTRHSRKRSSGESFSRRNSSFPGRNDHCPAGLEACAVG